MAIERKYDREMFEETCTRLDAGEELTFEMIGDIFLKQFWMMLCYSLMDAQDAARAIQGAINRLKAGGKSEVEAVE
jgi:hypothetical protein